MHPRQIAITAAALVAAFAVCFGVGKSSGSGPETAQAGPAVKRIALAKATVTARVPKAAGLPALAKEKKPRHKRAKANAAATAFAPSTSSSPSTSSPSTPSTPTAPTAPTAPAPSAPAPAPSRPSAPAPAPRPAPKPSTGSGGTISGGGVG